MRAKSPPRRPWYVTRQSRRAAPLSTAVPILLRKHSRSRSQSIELAVQIQARGLGGSTGQSEGSKSGSHRVM